MIRLVFLVAAVLCVELGQPAAASSSNDPDLGELSIEDLLNVEVTSVAKKAQSIFDSAAAITVISNEDIRRSGMTSVPELLRLVPGVQVARLSANRWAISSRGLNEEFNATLLVLLDGRSLYTHSFGGVRWDSQDYPLEDIERIEVIRGPGGTVWGENAVNGVINIITKSSEDTQGVLASGYGGSQEYGTTLRYGGEIGQRTSYRVFGKGFRQADYDLNRARQAHDDWRQYRGGLRIDSQVTDQDSLRFSGEFYDQKSKLDRADPTGVIADIDNEVRGWHLLGSWKRVLDNDSRFSAQAYYERTSRDESSFAEERWDTADLEIQHDFRVGSLFDMSWGGNLRYWGSHSSPIEQSVFDPNRANLYVGNVFLQGTTRLFDDRLTLTLGTKLGGNNWSGFEYQPSFRFIAKPVENHAIWGAVSRAVRVPTQAGRDVNVQLGPVFLMGGGNNVRSVDLTSFELGYRFRLGARLSAELSLYYNFYEDVRQLTFSGATATVGSLSEAQTRGLEFQVKMDLTDWWRVTAGYDYFDSDEDIPEGLFVISAAKNTNPDHQVTLRNSFDLGDQVELDALLFYVDGLSGAVPVGESDNVENYVRLDLRVGYRPFDWLELSVTGQNLTDRRHYEFIDVQGGRSSQIPRSVHGMARIEF